jgi:hemerythrin superfamily protein
MNLRTAMSRLLGNEGADESETAPAAPDALTLIHNDHEEVSALFEQALDDGVPAAKRRATIARLTEALTVHAKMEEAIFYPALRKAGKTEEKDSVLEAAEEHGLMKDLIAKISRLEPRDETLIAKVTVLKEIVEHHVSEEESTIFNEARKVLGGKLDKLGAEMQAFKERALAGKGSSRSKVRPAVSKPPVAKKRGSAGATRKVSRAKR